MVSLITLLVMGLTLSPLLVNCQMTEVPGDFDYKKEFCGYYMTLLKEWLEYRYKNTPFKERLDMAYPGLYFIPTKDKTFLYLRTFDWQKEHGRERLFELDASCSTAKKCPAIWGERVFSGMLGGLKWLRDVYFQDGFTYLIFQYQSTEEKIAKETTKVIKYENTRKIQEIEETLFWKNITHATVYEWKDGERTVKSRFVPPKSPGGPPLYGFSFDTFNGTTTVEVQGNYQSVNIVKNVKLFSGKQYGLADVMLTLYSFGDYLVPTQFYGYLPLPNGDDIFNIDPYPFYVRKNGAALNYFGNQNLNQLFGCDNSPFPEKVLTDTHNDNIYPSYDFKS